MHSASQCACAHRHVNDIQSLTEQLDNEQCKIEEANKTDSQVQIGLDFQKQEVTAKFPPIQRNAMLIEGESLRKALP